MRKIIDISFGTCDALESISKECGIMVKPLMELMVDDALKDEDFLNKLIGEFNESRQAKKQSRQVAKEAAKSAGMQSKAIKREERYKRSMANLIERRDALFAARQARIIENNLSKT